MAAPFKCDEQVTIERKTQVRDPDYGTLTDAWETVADHYWANVQDILPVRSAEATGNGIVVGTLRSRLRLRIPSGITSAMRVTLHNRGDVKMQIVAGPAVLDDREHEEFLMEAYSNG